MLKKFLLVTTVALSLIACGGNEASTDAAANEAGSTTSTENQQMAEPANTSGVSAEVADKGLTLIAQSDCLTCHKVEDRVVGPSYREIAAKYPVNDSTFSYLARKIIEGGAGVWGEVPMTAHPDLSQEDARTMAQYVMSLK